MKGLTLLAAATIVGMSAVACESRFVEPSPGVVHLHGDPLEQRLQQKAHVDARIEDVQKIAQRVQDILSLVRKTQNPSEREDVYTPIDFLIEANHELREKLPENHVLGLIRQGQINLPLTLVSEECRTVETLLKSSQVGIESVVEPNGEQLTYFIRTCRSGDEYLPVFELIWRGTTLEFNVLNNNLNSLIELIQVPEVPETPTLDELTAHSTCQVKQTQRRLIDSIFCENFDVRLSKSEHALIKNLTFSNTGGIRFEAIADIFENGRLKARSTTRLFSNGEVQHNLNKIEDPTPEAAEQELEPEPAAAPVAEAQQ